MQTVQFRLLVTAPFFLSQVLAADVCGSYFYKYCEDGYHCCDNDTECCSDSLLAIGAIIGIVIGCITFISCCVTLICCCVKQSHRPGQVVQPVQQPVVAVIATGNQQVQPMYGQPMYGQPSYGQPAYGQPQYGVQPTQGVDKTGSSDAAYPPPPPPAY